MGGEGDAIVGATEGRARRPHNGHRRGVVDHRADAARARVRPQWPECERERWKEVEA